MTRSFSLWRWLDMRFFTFWLLTGDHGTNLMEIRGDWAFAQDAGLFSQINDCDLGDSKSKPNGSKWEGHNYVVSISVHNLNKGQRSDARCIVHCFDMILVIDWKGWTLQKPPQLSGGYWLLWGCWRCWGLEPLSKSLWRSQMYVVEWGTDLAHVVTTLVRNSSIGRIQNECVWVWLWSVKAVHVCEWGGCWMFLCFPIYLYTVDLQYLSRLRASNSIWSASLSSLVSRRLCTKSIALIYIYILF